jgi:hypothetical protein
MMTEKRFRAVKHLTAALFAAVMVGIFVAGIDGVIRGVHELTRVLAARAPQPATEPPATPGVVPALILPPDGAATHGGLPREREPRGT